MYVLSVMFAVVTQKQVSGVCMPSAQLFLQVEVGVRGRLPPDKPGGYLLEWQETAMW